MFISKFSVEDWIGNQNRGSVEQAQSWLEIEAASQRTKWAAKDACNPRN